MPLEIAYRPIDLPPPLPRRAPARAPEASLTAEADSDFDRLKAQVLADRKAKRNAKPARLRTVLAAFGWRQRAVGVAAIGALGVVLATIGWGAPVAPARAASDVRQPFETPGLSFPGSAFYYLDPHDSGLVSAQAARAAWEKQSDTPAQLALDAIAPATGGLNPIARPLFAAGTGEDHFRAVQCLTAAIYYEAASEPDAGQRAVAQVVLNRVAHPAFPKTVCGVVYQGSERPGCQFSFACDGSMARRPMAQFWDRARRVAQDALAGNVFAPVGLSTHYHTGAVHPAWDNDMQLVDVIGAHRFYRWPGMAGRPSAFSGSYHGGEPLPAPHPRLAGPAPKFDIASNPVALARAFEQGRLAAIRQTETVSAEGASFGQAPLGKARNPSPQYAPEVLRRGGDSLYRAGGLPAQPADTVLPEYRDSGKWITQPRG